MTEAFWVYDLPAALIIGGIIAVVIGFWMLILSAISDHPANDKWFFAVPAIGVSFIVTGLVACSIGLYAPSHTCFTQEKYDIDQMAVDYGALEGDRGLPKLITLNLDRYDDAVLIRTKAFGHECWTYYPAKFDEYAAYKNE